MAASLARKVVRPVQRIVINLKQTTLPSQQKRLLSFSRCLAARYYTDKHEWVNIEGSKGTVGISKYAQDQLGEIVYVEFPEMGATLEAHDVAGCLESVKAASEVYSPVAGTVIEVNEKLQDQPALVNSSPLDEGWLFKLEVDPAMKSDDLMDAAAYEKFLGTLDSH